MFYYYGRKGRMVPLFEPPMYRIVVEPFAGSAAYACYHARSIDRAILIERDERVVALWHRLLALSDINEIPPLPDEGEYTDDLFHILQSASNAALSLRRLKVTKNMVDKRTHRSALRIVERTLPYTAGWSVHCGDYTEAPDIEATWFIDPPYQQRPTTANSPLRQGRGYRHHEIDYAALGEWCRTRRGQVIVCEQEGADWLPFRPLSMQRGTVGQRRVEVVWTNEPSMQLW